MDKWYEDEEIRLISEECDNAINSKDIDKLSQLSERCREKANDENNVSILRAKYFYNSFTCLSNRIRLIIIQEDGENTDHTEMLVKNENLYEECLYLCRRSISLARGFYKDELDYTDNSSINHYKGFYYSLIVNYSNLLTDTGRIVSAICELRDIVGNSFYMAHGSLGLKLLIYAKLDCDMDHRCLFYKEACKYLSLSVNSKDVNIDEKAKKTFDSALQDILRCFGKDFLEEKYDYAGDISPNMSSEEMSYREWSAYNNLSLNTLNDIERGLGIAHDSLYLPPMIASLKDNIIPCYQGLFNQIKQEYVSARYLAYDGLENRDTHFSDKEVMLVNTLDFPIYGLGIEKIKAAYRSIYSIFDKVAYFLNYYFELGFKDDKISYKKMGKGYSDKLNNLMCNNHPLLGLKWIFKDVSNKSVANYKEHIDPLMAKASEIRNAMEHRYLKVVDLVPDLSATGNTDIDKLAYLASLSEFKKLVIELLRYCRESIILLTMAIFLSEKEKQESLGGKEIMSIDSYEYEDDRKQVY